MARTTRDIRMKSDRYRTFVMSGLVKPHQTRKMLDQPRGLYDHGKGDAWGAEQMRTLKRIRNRRVRREAQEAKALFTSL